jgi:hypothetical protein
MKPRKKKSRKPAVTEDVTPHRKPSGSRKEASIRIRLTEGQRELIFAAAEAAGLDVSSWLRAVALEKAVEMSATAMGKQLAGLFERMTQTSDDTKKAG